VGGGGDGLALRELLKWASVQSITLVDIDPAMTRLAATNPALSRLNEHALRNPKVHVVNDDAMRFLQTSNARFDVVLLDFPDPTQFSLGKLFSTSFYASVRDHLTQGGSVGVQSTSPLLTRRSYWSIIATLRSVGFRVVPYRVFVPSFGDWGFALARLEPFDFPSLPASLPLKTLDRASFAALANMPVDTSPVPAGAKHLDNQSLVSTYLEEIARFD
jgi:spermidine synthase